MGQNVQEQAVCEATVYRDGGQETRLVQYPTRQRQASIHLIEQVRNFIVRAEVHVMKKHHGNTGIAVLIE